MEHKVGRMDELGENASLSLDLDGTPVGVFKFGHKVYAVKNLCPHKRAPLAMGTLEGTMLPTACAGEYNFGMEGQVLKCPWHGWEFDIQTGECLFGVSDSRVKTYPVVVRDGDIYVDL